MGDKDRRMFLSRSNKPVDKETIIKQVLRGYIRCDYFIVTICIIDYDVIG